MGKVAYTGRGSEAQWDGSGDGKNGFPGKTLGSIRRMSRDMLRASKCSFSGDSRRPRERESLM